MANKTDVFTRLLSKIEVDRTTGCWLWLGGKNNIGYGLIRDENKMRSAHRVSYEKHNNVEIPIGMCVCHKCDNPGCINPAHLWLGTQKENIKEMIDRGRHKFWGGKTRKGCKQPTTECPYCNRNIANNVYHRFHGDNCKLKPIV